MSPRPVLGVDAPTPGGRYRPLFDDLPPLQVDEEALHELGRPGGPCDLGVDFAEDADSRVAAVWPFFGQFIAHDITADRSPLGHRADPARSATSASRRPTWRASTAPARSARRTCTARTTPPSCCSRPTGGDVPRNHEGIALDRRSAQRRAPVHQPDAGRVHRAAQPAGRSPPRRRGRRAGRLRGGAARGHLALPARDPARVPARPHRRAADRRAARRRPAAVSRRAATRSSRSSSPTPPTATATPRSATATRSTSTSARARCSPT